MATNSRHQKIKSKIKQATLLWFNGFQQACSFHFVFISCSRSKKLLIRTGQCFLFNGFIFLGSVLMLKKFVVPMLQWMLPDHCPHLSYEEICKGGALLKIYAMIRGLLLQLIYLLWFYPLYVFSLILSNIWYNDIAQLGFVVMGKYKTSGSEVTGDKKASNVQVSDNTVGLGSVLIGIGEQVYSFLLLNFFLLEVFATGFLPFVGKALYFLLLPWMYAYYCFEYKWNLSGVRLDRRLDFFETNWAFFAGFGSPCALAFFFFSPLVSYAVMATLFPLFVLTATGSNADDLLSSPRKQWPGAGLGRLPIFCAADTLSMKVLSFLPWGGQEHTKGN